MGRWMRIVAGIIAGGLLTVALGAGAWVYPWIRDDVLLDWVVKAVALDWRDFGADAAHARLQYELDHQGIGLQVADSDCHLTELDGGARQVSCAWAVSLDVPGTQASWPLAFESVAVIDESGQLL